MNKLVLSISKIISSGLVATCVTTSFSYSFVIDWVEVGVECHTSTNTNPFRPECADYYDFTTDDSAVYWRGEKILGADPKSFEMINRYYAKDKNHVYQNFAETYRSYYDGSVPNLAQKQARSWNISTTHDAFWEVMYLADPKTFKVHSEYNEFSYDQNYLYHNGLLIGKTDGEFLKRLTKEYIKTDDAVFLYNQLLPQSDAKSFTVFDENRRVTKDKNNVYFDNEIQFEVKDPLSFKILHRDVAKDNQNIYSIDHSVKVDPKKDSSSFHLINAGKGISKDKYNVYHRKNVIEGADINSFQLFSDKSDYAKDYSKVFWLDWSTNGVIDADLNTFEINSINPKWAKDQNSVFYEGKKIEELDTKTFEVLGQNYIKDNANIYFHVSKSFIKHLIGVDIESFSIIDEIDPTEVDILNLGSNLSKDQFHVYYKENIVEKADPETFEILDKFGYFAIDKNYAFFKIDSNYSILENADRSTFALDKYGYDAEDKNNKYSSRGKVTSKTKAEEERDCNCTPKKISTSTKSSDRFIQLEFEKEYPDKYSLVEGEEEWRPFRFSSPYKYSRTGKYQIATQYWKNSKNVTYKKNYLPNVDIKSFEVIDIEFGKDNQHVYYQDKLIEGADAESFVVLDSDYSRDKNQLFYQQNKVIDLAKANYSGKPYRYYYGGTLLKRIYSEEMEIYQQLPYAKIGAHIFYQDKVINNIDGQTVYPLRIFDKNNSKYSSSKLSKYYIRDEHNVYYQTEKVEGADPNSFMVTEVPFTNPRYRMLIKAKDRFACYEEAKRVECK